jgi:hypothetical protein
MPVFNSSGAMPFGPGNLYGVGTGKFGAPTTITPPPPAPVTAEDFLRRLLLSCDQWLALPLDQKRYAAYLLCVEYRHMDDASSCPDEIVALITNHCQQLRNEKLTTAIKASGDLSTGQTAVVWLAGGMVVVLGYWAVKSKAVW